MRGHGRPIRLICVASLALANAAVGFGQTTIPNDGASEPIPGDPVAVTARPDACLRDVTIVDARHGWAVGDCGVIWHTTDGGEHWQQQSSGGDCRLESISFIDAHMGWAAGG